MTVRLATRGRRGTVLPLLAACLIGLFSFVALAVDLGMVAVARTDAQNAADISALAGARTLNNKPGVTDSNRTAAIAQAKAAVTVNYNVGFAYNNNQIQSVTAGQYSYDTSSQTFAVSYPTSIASGQSWTAMEVVVAVQQPTFFMKLWGVSSMPTGARAVAVHRPRDIALVIDMTGSMGYGSIPRLNLKISSAAPGLNDPSTSWPQFAHYQRYTGYNTNNITGSETATTISSRPNPFQQMGSIISAPYIYAPANLTIETPNGKAIVRDFYYDPSNLSDFTVAVTSTDGSTFRNAFHQWSPSESGGDPTNYVGPTYTMTGYDATDRTGKFGCMPAPDNFKDQSDTPIAYVGDKFPRKWGATSGTTWDPTDANGAAINLAEYLGWCPKYTGSGTWPGSPPSRSSLTPNTAYTTSGSGSTINWNNFRDATWERYGYDLDVADYIANRGSSWDPRWDWDLTANSGSGGWAHYRPTTFSTSATYRPKLKTNKFVGYSMGPAYYGKTFYIWPPDPRTPVGNPGDANYVPGDWRIRYFYNRSGGAFNPQVDADPVTTGFQTINTELFTDGTGATLNSSSGNWTANYTAILKWIKSGPMTLPPNLRSGHVLYYSSIPDTVTASGSDSAAVAADKVFWKAYIDYVLRDGDLASTEPKGWPEGQTPDIDASTTAGGAYGLPSSPAYKSNGTSGGTTMTADPIAYSQATDNPSRPRLHFWFGPMTMMLFLNEYNWWSGTTHQAQSWQLKAGVNSALDDIRNNHPNDYCGMAFFTTPRYTDIIVPIGQDYTTLKNSLFFPKSKLTALLTDNTAELRPYSSSGLSSSWGDIPNAQSSTDPVTGMALAYNILSPAPSLNSNASRRGRRGAAKVVIFETDGIPNSTQPYNLTKAGYNSYYTYGGSTPNTDPSGAAVDVVKQIVKRTATTSGTGVDSGFSLPNAPARVYAIGFGDIFSTTSGATAKTFLLNIQQAGNTSASTDTSIPSYQIITGTYSDRISNLRTGLERILQGGVQVTLIE